MGNSESATSDEEDTAMEETHNEVIKVFQPQKLRDELENGKNWEISQELRNFADFFFLEDEFLKVLGLIKHCLT